MPRRNHPTARAPSHIRAVPRAPPARPVSLQSRSSHPSTRCPPPRLRCAVPPREMPPWPSKRKSQSSSPRSSTESPPTLRPRPPPPPKPSAELFCLQRANSLSVHWPASLASLILAPRVTSSRFVTYGLTFLL